MDCGNNGGVCIKHLFAQDTENCKSLRVNQHCKTAAFPCKKKKDTQTLAILSKIITNLVLKIFKNKKDCSNQGYNARKVNCGRVYSAYILKPVLFGRNL